MRRSPFFDGVTQSDVTVAGQPEEVPSAEDELMRLERWRRGAARVGLM